MTRKTAVTEEITYNTQTCKICGTEVATDPSAPVDTFEPHGYAVILGEGKFRQEIEHEGNWDKELYFELEKEDSRLPTVEGYIICEDCAQSIHQHPEVARKYTGKIPRVLQPISMDDYSVDLTTIMEDYSVDPTTIIVLLVILTLFLIFILLV